MSPDAGRADAGALADAGGAIDAGGFDAGPGGCAPTEPDAQGPFYMTGAAERAQLAEAMEPGERIVMEGRVLSAADCATPLSGFVLDLWQADAMGLYDPGPRLRGRFTTGADGRFSVETVLPGNYAEGDGFRPSHVHAKIWGADMLERLTTQIYFAGDPYLFPNDSCGPPTCNSDDPGRIVTLNDMGTTVRRGVIDIIVPA